MGPRVATGEQKFKNGNKELVFWLNSNEGVNEPIDSDKENSGIPQHAVAKISLKLIPVLKGPI